MTEPGQSNGASGDPSVRVTLILPLPLCAGADGARTGVHPIPDEG